MTTMMFISINNALGRARFITCGMKLPLIGLLFGMKVKMKEGIPITKASSKSMLFGVNGYGYAMISVKHANFIINLGNATGKDIRSLIQLVHDEVERVYHIDLILEQEFKDW